MGEGPAGGAVGIEPVQPADDHLHERRAAGHQHPHPLPPNPLPAGLTDADAERVAAAIAAARTETTRHVYALIWAQWERWCASRGTPALPGDPLALCAYLTERAEAGKADRRPSTSTCCRGRLRPPDAPATDDPVCAPRPSARYAAG